MRRPIAVAACAALALALAGGCGDDEGGSGGGQPRLVVSAASSLTEALRRCSEDFGQADVRLSFAGSDELAAQIRQGVKPDVFVAANTKLPAELAREDLLETPRTFATNDLVLAVPKGSDVDAVEDLARRGVKLVIGSESVPIGDYTSEVLGRLDAPQRRAILANVRSEEPDVKGVIGKLVQGAADAGFVYRSDVPPVKDDVEAIDLEAGLKPTVAYGAGVVRGAKEPELAKAFLDDMIEGGCASVLQQSGFGPPEG